MVHSEALERLAAVPRTLCAVNYADYLASAAEPGDLLECWRWLVGPERRLWRPTKFGDAFLKDAADRILFLDTLEGKVEDFADSEAQFEAKLANVEIADRYLLAGLVDAAARRGLIPRTDECLQFKLPPQLGAAIELDNVEVRSLRVHFSMSGQMCQQLATRPPGFKITEFVMSHKGRLRPDRQRSLWRRIRERFSR